MTKDILDIGEVIVETGGVHIKFPLTVGLNFIGRNQANSSNITIKVPSTDLKVSRKHCCISVKLVSAKLFAITLFDTDSTNGTYIEGFINWPLTEYDVIYISELDRIIIGDSTVKIAISDNINIVGSMYNNKVSKTKNDSKNTILMNSN